MAEDVRPALGAFRVAQTLGTHRTRVGAPSRRIKIFQFDFNKNEQQLRPTQSIRGRTGKSESTLAHSTLTPGRVNRTHLLTTSRPHHEGGQLCRNYKLVISFMASAVCIFDFLL